MTDQRRVPEQMEATGPTLATSLDRLRAADASVAEFVAAGGLLSFRPLSPEGTRMNVSLSKLAYSLDEFAEAVSLSKAQIRKHIEAGDLVPSYSGAKPLVTREEGERWLRSLPSERAA